MSSRQRQQPTLVDQHEAVRDYLDALLQEIPDFDAEAAPVVEPTPVAPAEPEPEPVAAKPAVLDEPPAPVVEPEPAVARTPVQTPDPVDEEHEAIATVSEPPADIPPAPSPEIEEVVARGEETVQALFFTVGGLKLAVPLTELHSVVPWRDIEVTPMPRQPEWHMGLMRYRNRNVRVIDTVTMVLPPDKRQTEEALATPEHILVVGDGGWGLACHAIGDVVRLRPNEVKWRKRGSQRPWLAGTVIGHLSALIDTSAFTHMLETQAPKR